MINVAYEALGAGERAGWDIGSVGPVSMPAPTAMPTPPPTTTSKPVPGPRPPSELRLGRVGIWSGQFDFSPAELVREAVAELDELGYSTLWTGEVKGREVFVTAGMMLAATRRMTVATGIAQILARNPLTMAAGHLALSEAYPGRFLLGPGCRTLR